MRLKTLAISAVTLVSVSALAWGAYTITKATPLKQNRKPEKQELKSSDLFALQELVAVMNTYSKAATLDADFTTYLMSEDGQTVLESFEGRYVKDSANLYVKSYGSENLLNKEYLIAVDHDEHILFVERSDKEQLPAMLRSGFLSDIDSLVKLPDSLVFYEKLDAHTAKLVIDIPSGKYYRTEYIYDTDTRELKRMHMYPYAEVFDQMPEQGEIGNDAVMRDLQQQPAAADIKPGYIAIVYKHIDINKPLDQKWFDYTRYFTIENAKPVPTKRFKTYEIDFE